MRKFLVILFTAMLISSASIVRAGEVNMKNAQKVAVGFYYEKGNHFKTINYNDIFISNSFIEKRNNEAVYYIFNINNEGFVIVSADDGAHPVLGYSFERPHSTQNNSPQFDYWMDEYAQQISDIKAQNLEADIEAKQMWDYYLNSSPTDLKVTKEKAINPFLLTQWGQGKYFNKFTPYDPAAMDDDHCPTGCVATAMAAVMYYYRYPESGFGTKTYNANNSQYGYGDYGYLSANFENTIYDYDQMLLTYNNNSGESSTQVSRLMYHAGVSVSMMYGPDGSGTGMDIALSALKVYWKFSTSLQLKERAGTLPSQWLSYMTTNLDDKKPIIYAGRESSGAGHAWLCDGYQGADYFHFDWGWEGSDNGFYYLNNLNTSNGTYNSEHEALFNIYPKNSYPSYCSGHKDIIGTSGTIEDGSGKYDYQDNSDCTWLIKAPGNDSIYNITLKWHAFDTESGQDIVTVYDGSSTSDPLLGTYSGNSTPPDITSSGTEMLIRFVTNGSVGKPGWMASYSTSGPVYCNINNIFDATGTIDDGSHSKNYQNNTSCLYFIRPTGASQVNFTLTKFDTEKGYDYLTIKDAVSGALLAQLSGKYHVDSLPPTLTAQSGQIQLLFQSDYANTGNGWTATWDTLGPNAIAENDIFKDISIYPNPAENILNLNFNLEQNQSFNINLISSTGSLVYSEEILNFAGNYKTTLDLTHLMRGVYFLQLVSDKGILNRKIVLQ